MRIAALVAFGLFVLTPSLSSIAAETKTRVNLALHRPYTWAKAPSYHVGDDPMCTDEGDKVQLTDGLLSTRFWWDKQMVALAEGCFPLTFDLGKVCRVGEVVAHAASCPAAWMFPPKMDIYVGNTPEEFRFVRRWVRPTAQLESDHCNYQLLNFGEINHAARYVTLMLPGSDVSLYADEIYIFEAASSMTMGDIAKLPLYTSPQDHLGSFATGLPAEIGLIRNRAAALALTAIRSNLATLEVDLPAGVTVAAPKPVKTLAYVDAQKAERTVYTLKDLLLASSLYPWIFLQDARAAGTKGVMTLTSPAANGRVQRQQLEIVSVEVPHVGKFRRLTNGISWAPTETLSNWPGFLDLYASSGFNTYATIQSDFRDDSSLPLMHRFIENCQRHGIWVAANLSPFNPSPGFIDLDPGIGCWFKSDGTKVKFPCPIAYRRQWTPKRELPVLARGAEMGITFWILDSEASLPEEGKGCCCPECVDHFRRYLKENFPGLPYVEPKELLAHPAKYPAVYQAWLDARDQVGLELFKLYRDTVIAKSQGRASISPPGLEFGNYDTTGDTSRPYLNYQKLIASGVFNYGNPPSYWQEPYLAGQRLLNAVQHQGRGKTIAWISRELGMNQTWYPLSMLRPLIFEVFLNGLYGFQSFSVVGWDGFAFREHARAMQALLPIEDILAEGQPLADAMKPDDHSYAIGMRLRNEAVVMVQSAEKRKVRDYSAKYEGEIKVHRVPFYELTSDAKVCVTLPECFVDAEVTDLEAGTPLKNAIAKTGDGCRLEVTLTPAQPFKVLHLGRSRPTTLNVRREGP